MHQDTYQIEGVCRHHVVTKRLVQYIQPGEIAVLAHRDIDPLAAEELLRCQIKAVINLKTSMSGTFHHRGVDLLLNEDIPVFDMTFPYDQDEKPKTFNFDQRTLKINEHGCWVYEETGWRFICSLFAYNQQTIAEKKARARSNYHRRFRSFARNSLFYANKDLSQMVKEMQKWKSNNRLKNREVLLVVRGEGYEHDLKCMRKWLKKKNLVKVAVDGAANGMIRQKLIPDFIVGDMDSLNDEAVACGAEFFVHSRPNGDAPGERMMKAQQLPYQTLPFVGLSEDAALSWVFTEGADHVYFLGGFRGMDEYLGKGRKGMGSTLLMKMWAGDRMTDLKGLHHLFQPHHSLSVFEKVSEMSGHVSSWIKEMTAKQRERKSKPFEVYGNGGYK